MALLMTPTLWNSIDWYHTAPLSWKTKAYKDLYNMLARKWTTNKYVERGMKFEDEICNGTDPFNTLIPDESLVPKFKKAYDMIHAEGHDFQHKLKKFIEYDYKDFVLYGKTDVYFDDHIIDIKTTSNWKGQQKYLSTWQHKVYCYISGIKTFVYIVFIFNDVGLLHDIKFVNYEVLNFEVLEEEITNKLKSVVKFLRSDEKLKTAYMTKFNRYN